MAFTPARQQLEHVELTEIRKMLVKNGTEFLFYQLIQQDGCSSDIFLISHVWIGSMKVWTILLVAREVAFSFDIF